MAVAIRHEASAQLPARRSRHQGRVLLPLICALLGTSALMAYVAYSSTGDNDRAIEIADYVHPVVRQSFEYFVTERGDVESAGNVEIRCKVKSNGTPGVAILHIHPEGEFVKQGDTLVQFDDSLFRQQLIEQEIITAQAESLVMQAKSDLRTAEIALEEYVEGAFEQANTLIESEVFVAQENVRRGEQYLRFSRTLAAKGYVTEIQLEADRFAVEKARNDLRTAETKLNVHREFTYKKMVAQLEAAVEKLKANVKAAESTLALSVQKKNEIQEQIGHCHVVAPQDGQVVYASVTEDREEEAIVIEEGAIIRQGQAVILLPDPSQMRVGVKVSETKIGLVKRDSPAQIYFDTDPQRAYRGVVRQIGGFPLPKRRSYYPNEYRAVVEILDPSAAIRPGLRAKVRILVDSYDDALQIPIDAVFTHADKHFCIRRQGDADWQARQLRLGPNNEEFVIIENGLREGEMVAMNPDDYRDIVPLSTEDTDPEFASAPTMSSVVLGDQ